MTGYDIEQQRIRRSLTRLMAIGFAALSGVVLSAAVLMAANQRQMGWIAHTYQVEQEADVIRLSSTRIQAARWRNAMMPTAESRANAADARRELTGAIARFAAITTDNPLNQARLPLLRAAARAVAVQSTVAPMAAPTAGTASDKAIWAATETHEALQARLDDITSITPAARTIVHLCAAIRAEEENLLAQRVTRLGATQDAFYALLGIAALLLVATGGLIITTLSAYTRDLDESRRALRDANQGLEAAVRDRTVELQRANNEIQRFAYIVSHDLRSPLVNVLGFTSELETATNTLRILLDERQATRPETVNEQARVIITEDLPEAIHFIRSSTHKMDRLINAILRLSREGRRTMNPEWVDLGALVGTVVDSMRTSIDDAGATLTIGADMPTIHCDRLAVEQMVANLIENAVKYSLPGRAPEIAVTSRRSGPRITLDIADNGRGIEPRDHARVFDLFRRSGPQDKPGEGIGLAHVRALAHRLGGAVDVTSEPGKGSTFTISLPIYFTDNQDQVP